MAKIMQLLLPVPLLVLVLAFAGCVAVVPSVPSDRSLSPAEAIAQYLPVEFETIEGYQVNISGFEIPADSEYSGVVVLYQGGEVVARSGVVVPGSGGAGWVDADGVEIGPAVAVVYAVDDENKPVGDPVRVPVDLYFAM